MPISRQARSQARKRAARGPLPLGRPPSADPHRHRLRVQLDRGGAWVRLTDAQREAFELAAGPDGIAPWLRRLLAAIPRPRGVKMGVHLRAIGCAAAGILEG